MVDATLACALALFVPVSALPARSRLIGAGCLNLVLTLLALSDVVHQRLLGDIVSAAELLHASQLLDVLASVREAIQLRDLLFLSDLAVVAIAAIAVQRRGRLLRTVNASWSWKRPVVLASAAALLSIPTARTALHDQHGVFAFQTTRREVVAVVGLLGYHAYDVARSGLQSWRRRPGAAGGELDRVAALVAERRAHEEWSRGESPLFGLARDRSVLLILAESLHAFPIGLRVEGQMVAPHLTALAGESLYFERFYDQTHTASTADAELLVLQSLHPLESGAVQTRLSSNRFRALPSVLAERGYATLSICGQRGDFWNMRSMHRRFGFERSVFLDELQGERLGLGLADRDVFRALVPLLRELDRPYFAFALTLTNHHPYELPRHHRKLSLPGLEGTITERYLQSVRAFDEALGVLLVDLREAGLLDRTIVALVGDHQAWLGSPPALRDLLDAQGPGSLWLEERRIPFLVRLPGGEQAIRARTSGGLLDVAPTLLALLGFDREVMPAALGTDLTRGEHALVIRRDGDLFLGGRAFRAEPDGALRAYDAESGRAAPVARSAATRLARRARAQLELSDRMLFGDLIPQVRAAPLDTGRGAPSRSLVIAHRGNSSERPENTLVAIRDAFRLGASVVEVDLRLSAEGVLYLFHDDELDRTSDGTGPVSGRPFSELRALDVGSWFHQRYAGERVPTLAEALEVAAEHGGRLLLDVKERTPMAERIAVLLDELALPDRMVMIGAWTEQHLAEYRVHLPGAELLWNAPLPERTDATYFAGLRADGIDAVETNFPMPEGFLRAARHNGMPVIVFTVNDRANLHRLLARGVAGIETDVPSVLGELVRESPGT